MQIFQAIAILVVFLICVVLMMTRKLPTILMLPIMAVVICLIGGIPFLSKDPEAFTIAKDVLEGGAMRMSTGIAGLIFGGWYGRVLTKVGVTKTIIRKAAELAGDKPLPIALAFLVVCSMIFAGSNGTGMVILVGTIIIPIMISAGFTPWLAGTVLLLANAIGNGFAVNTLGIYMDTLALSVKEVTDYSLLTGLPLIIVAFIMVIYFTKAQNKKRKAWAMPSADEMGTQKNVRTIALITPIIPVLLIFIFKMPLVPAIMIGLVVTLLLSTPKNPIQVLSSGIVEGIQDTAGAIALMIGIGMVLKAVMAPQISEMLSPVISSIVPSSRIAYILFFGIFSFLAIYRGPLNVFGLGSGIVALLAGAGMSPIAAMVALRLDSNVQCVCDPTNSHNVWVADFTKTDVNEYLKKTIAWIMVSTFLGLIVASFFVF